MKALFIRCYGKLTADMMIGGLIDMGVPPVYLKSKLKDAGLPDNFIENQIRKPRFPLIISISRPMGTSLFF